MIGKEWHEKQLQYLNNTLVIILGKKRRVNITDGNIADWDNIRPKGKRKQTIKRNYNNQIFLQKGSDKKWICSLPEFPTFTIKKRIDQEEQIPLRKKNGKTLQIYD